MESGAADTVRTALDQFESSVATDLAEIDGKQGALKDHAGIEIFALTDRMLTRAVELSELNMELKPFDQAILAAVLVKGEELRDRGEMDVAFCELDGDLRPWDRNGEPKRLLTSLYDTAKIWVYRDFAMESPVRRPGF